MNHLLLILLVASWVPVLISSISLTASLIVAYISNFKASRPGVLTGSHISVYPAGFQTAEGIRWGGMGIYVPITFYNWSPNGGSIMECRITLERADTPNQIYDMSWYEFAEMLQSERRMGNGGAAQPIAMSPRSSMPKKILFIWSPFSSASLKLFQGQYLFNVLVWTKTAVKPNIRKSFEFSITPEQEAEYNAILKDQTSLTIDVPIREASPQNHLITKDEAARIYRLRW